MDGRERTENPAATTAVPLLRDLTYNLLDQNFNVTQSVLSMFFLRRDLDRGGGTGEDEYREGYGKIIMDLYGKLVHINK